MLGKREWTPGERLLALLKRGNDTATQNRYSLEGKNVEIVWAEPRWKVYYSIIPEPGKGVLGGDFTVFINAKTLEVEEIVWGR